MKKFFMKKQSEMNVGDIFAFLTIYMALYLGVMWIVMEFETVTGKIKSAWRRVKNFFKKIKTKLIG